MDTVKIRTILNILFMIGFVITIILYFAVDDNTTFVYACAATICIKFVEICIRIMPNKKR